jgi:hypothetical protein
MLWSSPKTSFSRVSSKISWNGRDLGNLLAPRHFQIQYWCVLHKNCLSLQHFNRLSNQYVQYMGSYTVESLGMTLGHQPFLGVYMQNTAQTDHKNFDSSKRYMTSSQIGRKDLWHGHQHIQLCCDRKFEYMFSQKARKKKRFTLKCLPKKALFQSFFNVFFRTREKISNLWIFKKSARIVQLNFPDGQDGLVLPAVTCGWAKQNVFIARLSNSTNRCNAVVFKSDERQTMFAIWNH